MKRALHFATKLNYSIKRGSVGNILLLPRAKMLFVAMIFFLWGLGKNVLFSVTITSFRIHNSIAARCMFTIFLKFMERFHSRGHHLCKFIRTKESVCIRKECNPTGMVWDTNMATVSLFWDTNVAAVTLCENTLFDKSKPKHISSSIAGTKLTCFFFIELIFCGTH